MGSWDSIYQNYQQGGNAWASLSKDINQRFIDFIRKSEFPQKKALDVGCGTGKYLLFLENLGFVVNGIDSSPTAIEMTKKVVTQVSHIQQADMYEFSYPQNEYGLVLSVSTLHHGRKSQVKNAIKQIHRSLTPAGNIFITLPNFDASNTWNTFKNYTKIEPGTYSPNSGPEEGIPHSFFSKQEVQALFSKFKNVLLNLDEIGRWFIIANK